jgi:hypothetical protein
MYPNSNKPFIFDLESVVQFIQWNFMIAPMLWKQKE